MAWFDPSIAEMSVIEQIETAYYDTGIQERDRKRLLNNLWAKLESMHGDQVLRLVSPEGQILFSPLAKQ